MTLGSSDSPSRAPRHGKHSAAPASGVAPRPAVRPAANPGSARIQARIPSVGTSEQDAPRPIGVDPAVTGSFQRIDASMGATVETRQNVSTVSADSTSSWSRIGYGAEMRLQGKSRPHVKSRERKYKTNRNLFVGLGVAALVVVIIAGVLVFRALNSVKEPTEPTVVEQTQVSAGEELEYRGVTFRIQTTDNGTFGLFSYNEGSEQGSLVAELEGTPVQIVLYNGAILMPENVGDHWDVVAYTIGDSVSKVVDADGNPVGGSGEAVSVSLEDPNLLVTDDAGNVTKVALA